MKELQPKKPKSREQPWRETHNHNYYFENDVKRILEYTEMIRLGLITNSLDVTLNNYAYSMLTFLKLNLRSMLAYYNTSASVWEARQKYVIQKRVIMIYYNLMQANSGV